MATMTKKLLFALSLLGLGLLLGLLAVPEDEAQSEICRRCRAPGL
jgi:hypothetical protein